MTRDNVILAITAICAIAVVESVALLTGHNGTLLRLALVLIAGLGGFSIAEILRLRKQ